MKSTIEFLKRAVDRSGGPRGCYIFRGGHAYAQNGAFQAGAPLDLGGLDACVHAADLEAALGRMDGEPRIRAKDDLVVITHGRLRQTMRTFPGAEVDPAISRGEWHPAPATMAAALGRAAAFTGGTSWTKHVRLTDGRVVALHNKAGIDVEVPGMPLEGEVVVSVETAQYLAALELEEFQQQENALMFRWADGRWLRCQLQQERFGPAATIDKIFGGAGTDAPCQITDEWRAAYADAAALSDGHVQLLPDRFIVRKDSAVAEVACATPVPAGHSSRWETAVLDMVVAVAAAWNPAAVPEHVLFVGDGFRGVCMGFAK